MRKRTAPTPTIKAMRARHHAEKIEAMRDGRILRAHTLPNGKAKANKNACRGRFV